MDRPEATDERRRATRRLLGLLALLAVPWSVQVWTTPTAGVALVFPWGLGSVDPLHAVPLWEYLDRVGGWERLPSHLAAWPLASLFLCAAVASEALDRWSGAGDPRLTAGLLVLAGVSFLRTTLGLDGRGLLIPTGPVLTALVLWWGYVPLLLRE